ncbi:hypothetical protein BN2497_4987 [Janthinobacterium sp. CG23_2]|nr:hypothetical protein BN2497_4987 [Janthinobacterium sp. CG23_2]CUU28891.1 hypothetical protein BN3177_4987 [Janthinobacterium sp. CG23_2]
MVVHASSWSVSVRPRPSKPGSTVQAGICARSNGLRPKADEAVGAILIANPSMQRRNASFALCDSSAIIAAY